MKDLRDLVERALRTIGTDEYSRVHDEIAKLCVDDALAVSASVLAGGKARVKKEALDNLVAAHVRAANAERARKQASVKK